MSRYALTPDGTLIVGWDPPLQTFFAHVLDDEGELLEGRGVEPFDQLYELDDLQRALPAVMRPHWTPELARRLYADRDEGR